MIDGEAGVKPLFLEDFFIPVTIYY